MGDNRLKAQRISDALIDNLVKFRPVGSPNFLCRQQVSVSGIRGVLTEASMLAPLSSLGSASMLTTESKIFSTDCTGLHRSELLSYMLGSSPGGWRMLMQTRPSV